MGTVLRHCLWFARTFVLNLSIVTHPRFSLFAPQLNGWTEPMMRSLFEEFAAAAKDETVDVLVLTGAGKYYCAGVNLSGVLQPMHPQKLHDTIYTHNKQVFDTFLDFPKPIIAAINGPAIGASVTTATLCDALIMADGATLLTPFARLGVPPEGCSSVHFARIMAESPMAAASGASGATLAARMLGPEAWTPTGAEAVALGLASAAAPEKELLAAAQQLAEGWIMQRNLTRTVPQPESSSASAAAVLEEYRAINDAESKELARAFLGPSFLEGQIAFLSSKGKAQMAAVFRLILATRPLWSKLLSPSSDILRHKK